MDISTFASAQLDLLSAELKAETEETSLLTSNYSHKALARAGLAILNLNATSQRTGLGGKTVVDFELDPAVAGGDGKAELPDHGIRTGDIVGVREHGSGSAKKEKDGKSKEASGVVVRVGQGKLSVALDKEDTDVPGGGQKVWVYVSARHGMGRGQRLIVYVESSLQMTLPTSA